MKIAVAGTGYVGLSLAVLLSQHNEVTAVDIIPEKVEMINDWRSPNRTKSRKCRHCLAFLDIGPLKKLKKTPQIAPRKRWTTRKRLLDCSWIDPFPRGKTNKEVFRNAHGSPVGCLR